MAKMYGKGKTAAESEEQQKLRFQVELEFVQCLANPNYLNFLAQRGYFKDQAFINYLKYLLYWKEPEYAKYLMYPMSLYFLDLLQYDHFRREIVNSQCCKFIDDQAILQWQHYIRKRIKLLNAVNGTPNANGGGTNGEQQQLEAQQLQPQQQAQQQQQQQLTTHSNQTQLALSLQNGVNNNISSQQMNGVGNMLQKI